MLRKDSKSVCVLISSLIRENALCDTFSPNFSCVTPVELMTAGETININKGSNCLRISHWNVGGPGDHGWDEAAIVFLAGGLNSDVIVLSETKTFQPTDVGCIGYGVYKLAPIKKGNRQRGLMLFYNPHTVEKVVRVKMGRHTKKNFEFLSADVSMNNLKKYRIVIAYNQENVEDCAKLYLEREDDYSWRGPFSYKKESNPPVSVTLLADNNLKGPKAKILEAKLLKEKNLKMITERNLIDQVFTSHTEAHAYKPLNPYEALLAYGKFEYGNCKIEFRQLSAHEVAKLKSEDKLKMKEQQKELRKNMQVNDDVLFHIEALVNGCDEQNVKKKAVKPYPEDHLVLVVDLTV